MRLETMGRVREILVAASLAAGPFFVATPALALDPSTTNTQYALSSWESDDGLPQNSVAGIVQTPDGYLWFGTEEGLARFDGVRFTTFLARENIDALLVASDGALWVAVSGGLVRYKDNRMTSYSPRAGLGGATINSMSEGPDGTIWMATRSGLNRYDHGKFSSYLVSDGSTANWILATYVTRDGAVWCGTNGSGLKRFYRGAVTTFTTRDGLAGNIVTAIRQDRKGDLWIGTSSGLSRVHDGKITTFRKNEGLSSDSVNVIQEDRDGNLWIGTSGSGLNRYFNGKFTSFGTQHRLSAGAILSLMEDREGSLWVGTSGGGVSQLRPSKFITVGQSEGLNADMVWTVRESIDGSLLIGTNRGFSRWKDGFATSLTVRNDLPSDIVRAVMEDRAGAVWLGTNEGAARYDHGKLTVYRTADGLPDNTVRMVAEDRQGNIWIGTRGGGLARYRDGAFQIFNTANGLVNNVVVAMDEDDDGGLWFATDGGVSFLKNGSFTNYTVRDGLSSDKVIVIHHDRQGGHWIGTDKGGLNRIKNGRITPILMKDGLFDDVVFAILEDRSGYLWMSCNHGVFRVRLSELNDFADGKIKRVHSDSFDETDGMKTAECNGSSPGGWEARDGRLFFATVKGVAIIDPNHMALNRLAPPVWNEEILLDGNVENVSSTGLTVGPGRHSLEIHYTALSFIAPKKVRFRFRLRGFSEDWVDAGSRRTAFYTGLPPGKYTFEVMGSNNDEVWSTVKNPLHVEFQAAYFETWWFKFACAIGLLLAAGAVFAMRLRFLKEGELLLVKRVDEQTAELSAGKDAAEAIAEINTQLRLKNELILNSIADGVYAIDLSGNISTENPAAASMLGWNATELVGRPAHQTTHHSTLAGPYAKDDCPIYKTLADGVIRQVSDEVFWRKDGTSFPVDYLAAPILDGRKNVTGVAVTFRDVTQQRAVERLKNEFVSTVSHELRTPLTSIRGALGLLSSGMLGPIAEKGQRMLHIAVTNTDRLVRLINDILDLERIDAGKIELACSDVDAGTLITQAVEGVQSMADEAGVSLVAEHVRATLWIDSDRIMQTLTNLLSNAIKFSPRGTTVTLSGSPAQSNFTFCVADEGRGVPADKFETIFERFQQVDASDSRDKGGSGLGLAICRSIVTAHQGRIWASRNVPSGSLFQFSIPTRNPSALPGNTLQMNRKTLLFCGDNAPPFLKMLESEGFNVVCAAGWDHVKSDAEAISPDAVILDLADNAQVEQVVEALQLAVPTRKIPIVVISSASPAQTSVDAGITAWVRKPFQFEDLLRAVATVCESPTVLIVEDDADLARVMTAALQSRGIRTLHAETGQEAVDLCLEQNPVLIVLDLILPDMDGFAIVEALRKQNPRCATSLLVYSAQEISSAEQVRLKLGPTEFLTKSRGSIHDFESQVIRLLGKGTAAEVTPAQAA